MENHGKFLLKDPSKWLIFVQFFHSISPTAHVKNGIFVVLFLLVFLSSNPPKQMVVQSKTPPKMPQRLSFGTLPESGPGPMEG